MFVFTFLFASLILPLETGLVQATSIPTVINVIANVIAIILALPHLLKIWKKMKAAITKSKAGDEATGADDEAE